MAKQILSLVLTFLLLGVGTNAQASMVCDVNGDGVIDRIDIQLISAARNQPASGPDDPRDADGDGMITVRDARICSQRCTLPNCEIPAPVPDLSGFGQAAAEAALTAAGLSVGIINTAASDTVPVGDVLDQNPPAGTSVQPGSAVDLVLSSGPEAITVPDVLSLGQAAAEAALTDAGLSVGTITTAASDTVPVGEVLDQNPPAGTSVQPGSAVDLVLSSGPADITNQVFLELDKLVVSAGNSIGLTVRVEDDFGNVDPAPVLNIGITFNPTQTQGTVPIVVADSSIQTATDTRGAYWITVTDTASGAEASAEFVVLANEEVAGQQAAYATQSGALQQLSGSLDDLVEALDQGDLLAIQNAHAGLLAARDSIDPAEIELTTAFAPVGGFPPTPKQVADAGFPQSPDDQQLATLVPLIIAKLEEIIEFFDTLDPASPVDDDAVLQQLNSELESLVVPFENLDPGMYGVVDAAPGLNFLLADVAPRYLHALAGRMDLVLKDEGLVRLHHGPEQFFALRTTISTPEEWYAQGKPVFFGLTSLVGGSSIQVKLVNRVYGPAFKYLENASILLAANALLQPFQNQVGIVTIITGASQSFHIFNAANSVIEGLGFNTDFPKRHRVYLVGPNQVNAARGVLDAFNADVNGKDLNSIIDWIKGVVDAVEGAGQSAQEAYQLPNETDRGCLFSFDSACYSLVYPDGFKSVYKPSGFISPPSPVLVFVNNQDTGGWGFGIFNFIASN